jgi:hypothetical protein
MWHLQKPMGFTELIKLILTQVLKNILSASKNQKVQYSVHKSQPPDIIIRQFNIFPHTLFLKYPL